MWFNDLRKSRTIDVDVDEIINLSNEMLKMMKEMKKEESNQ